MANTQPLVDNPPPDTYEDIKPGLSEQELAALTESDDDQGDNEVAAGGEPETETEKTSASPRPEESASDLDAAGGDTTEELDLVAQAEAEADQEESGTPPNAEPDEIPRGAQLVTQIRPTRNYVEDIDGTIGTIDGQLDELETKLDEGDIELSQFIRESRRLNNERQELVADRREQMILQNTNAALYETDWNTSVGNFMETHSNFQNEIMMGALEAALKQLYANPDNVGSSHYWYLETARRAVQEQITPQQASADNPPDNQDSPQQRARAAISNESQQRAQKAAGARQKVPTNLSQVPAAQDNPGDDDEFSNLDSLDGIALEQALAKMTEAQADRYLKAGR
jgi:hypothetical protein